MALSPSPVARIEEAIRNSVALRPPSTMRSSPPPPEMTRSFGLAEHASSHAAGIGAMSISSGRLLASHAYTRPLMCPEGAATT